MNDRNPLDREEREMLAAEYALGILSGADLADAEALARGDPHFAAEAGRWTGRLAPLLDEVGEAPPPPGLWDKIAARIEAETEARPANVLRLKRRASLWRGYAAVATAIAASLAWLLVTRPPPAPPAAPVEPPTMVAAMAAEGSAARLVARWSPERRSLVVATAAGPAPAPGHGHELWVIPADGKPRAMGMMPHAGAMRAEVSAETAALLREGATLAISIEPATGSPTGLPTGPVIAAGRLIRA
jgi:anti-sigma-K factor RskA